MDDQNSKKQDPIHQTFSPQPGSSRYFNSIQNENSNSSGIKLSNEQINDIAKTIFLDMTRLLGSITHRSITKAIHKQLERGSNKLYLQDLVPCDFDFNLNRKRHNSEDISGIDKKKSRDSIVIPTPRTTISRFLTGNSVFIDDFLKPPVSSMPSNSSTINDTVTNSREAQTSIFKNTINHVYADVAGGSSNAMKGVRFAEINYRNDFPVVVIEDERVIAGPVTASNQQPFNNQVQPSPSTSNAGNKVCEEIYQKLRAMFPSINREYIKSYCPVYWAPGYSHDEQFSSIVERILLNEDSWVIDNNPNNLTINAAEDNGPTPNVDDTYEYLTGIFPNADPHYLMSAAENFKNRNDVETFVHEKLKSKNYPTREQSLAKIKVTEEQQRYTTNFNVEQFLSLFPDPFKHFEGNKRKAFFKLDALEFLKNEFRRVRYSTILQLYRRYDFNISLAAKDLRSSTDFIQKPRRAIEVPTENISLLQEMAFVRHYQEISNYMEMVKQREQEEFRALKAAGSLLTCQCCFDEECMPSKCSTCENGHVFCNSCVIQGTDTKLADGETRVPCFLNCESEFSLSTLQKVLPPTKFSILLKKRQAAEVMAAGLEGLVSCPFCHFASIPPEGDKVFKCFNPECMKESCIQCKEPNHVPYKCGELVKKDKARKYIEEKMTQALTRTCYQCKKVFFKEEGCNKMCCPCGAMMCFICDQPVKSYDHFRGQGSTKMDKCPLWSDNIRLNVETVRKVEEEARAEILRQDPSIHIETNELVPTLPPPTQGPHRNKRETHNLANVLAARVLNDGPLNLDSN